MKKRNVCLEEEVLDHLGHLSIIFMKMMVNGGKEFLLRMDGRIKDLFDISISIF